jgi:predicted tellurium resistance membrane protein TerC
MDGDSGIWMALLTLTVKILALRFLLLVGLALIGDGLDMHIPKGYIYFAMAFSIFVEMLNSRIQKGARHPVKLHRTRAEKIGDDGVMK